MIAEATLLNCVYLLMQFKPIYAVTVLSRLENEYKCMDETAKKGKWINNHCIWFAISPAYTHLDIDDLFVFISY